MTQKPPFKIQKVQVLFCISDNTETNYRICKIFTGFLNTSTISTQTNCTRFWFRAARDRPHLLPPTSAQLRPTPGLPIAHLPDLYRRDPEVFFGVAVDYLAHKVFAVVCKVFQVGFWDFLRGYDLCFASFIYCKFPAGCFSCLNDAFYLIQCCFFGGSIKKKLYGGNYA